MTKNRSAVRLARRRFNTVLLAGGLVVAEIVITISADVALLGEEIDLSISCFEPAPRAGLTQIR